MKCVTESERVSCSSVEENKRDPGREWGHRAVGGPEQRGAGPLQDRTQGVLAHHHQGQHLLRGLESALHCHQPGKDPGGGPCWAGHRPAEQNFSHGKLWELSSVTAQFAQSVVLSDCFVCSSTWKFVENIFCYYVILRNNLYKHYFEKLLKSYSYERIDLVCNVTDGNLAEVQDQRCFPFEYCQGQVGTGESTTNTNNR